MLYTRKIFLIVLISCFTLSAQEIEIPRERGARNAAMGNANISDANDVSSMYLNPATIAFLRNRSLFLNHGQINKEYGMTENIAIPVILSSSFTISAGIETYHLGYIQEHPELPGQQILEYSYSASAAYAIIPVFSIGVTAGFRNGETHISKAWGPFYAVGINYSPTADINYGITFYGLGDDITYFRQDSVILAKRFIPNKKLVLGASMRYPSTSSLRRTLFVLSLANEKIFGMDGIFYRAGFELRPHKNFDIRLGYSVGPGLSEPRVGAGLNINIFVLEYTRYFGPSPGMSDQVSLSVKF